MGASASTPAASQEPNSSAQADVCPVDHKTRAAWLSQNQNSAVSPHPPSGDSNSQPSDAQKSASSNSSSAPKLHRPLSQDREISSIPRSFPSSASKSESSAPDSSHPPPPSSPYAVSHGSPSNSESETGHDAKTGKWIYPSERQFFEALVKKGTPTSTNSTGELATSVASIIPIHNAVNERAWSEVLSWESKAPTPDPGSKKCGGPRLYSFRGLGVESQFLSPRARLNSLMGYQLPFDRHDWVVERCGGERVEYVIDFYQGRGSEGGGLNPGAGKGKLNFYLDVRPKLNSWEGWRMRIERLWG